MGKTGRFRMDTKKWFLASGMAAGIVLVIVLVTLRMLYLSGVIPGDIGVSIYGVVVDFVVGAFTIVGLYLAISEFAKASVKPDLHLVIGKMSVGEGWVALTNEGDALIGRDTVQLGGRAVSQVLAALYLENTRPKAARYVQGVVHVRLVPWVRVEKYLGAGGEDHKGVDCRMEGGALRFYGGEDFVVYKGPKVRVSCIMVDWPPGSHPKKITFVAKLYSLEGEPKEVTVSHPIHWIGEAA